MCIAFEAPHSLPSTRPSPVSLLTSPKLFCCALSPAVPSRSLSTAARLGHREMLRYLLSTSLSVGVAEWQTGRASDGTTLSTLGFIMESDHLDADEKIEMMDLCVTLGCPLTAGAFVSAAKLDVGDKPWKMMEWLMDNQCPVGSEGLICSAAADRPVSTIPRMSAQKCYGVSRELANELVGHDQLGGLITWPLALVRWLHVRGYPLTTSTMTAAAKHGNIKLLEWAHARGCRPSANTLDIAAYHGHVTVCCQKASPNSLRTTLDLKVDWHAAYTAMARALTLLCLRLARARLWSGSTCTPARSVLRRQSRPPLAHSSKRLSGWLSTARFLMRRRSETLASHCKTGWRWLKSRARTMGLSSGVARLSSSTASLWATGASMMMSSAKRCGVDAEVSAQEDADVAARNC